MKQLKYSSAFFMTLALLFSVGCASTSTHEGSGEYVDDSVKGVTSVKNDMRLK